MIRRSRVLFIEKLRFPKIDPDVDSKSSYWLRTAPQLNAFDIKNNVNDEFPTKSSDQDSPFIHSTFFKYGMGRDCTQAVLQMGLSTPTQVQDLAIPKIINGKNVMLIAQTGTGKTLAYALPLVDKLNCTNTEKLAPYDQGRIRALVVVPSRELAKQVMRTFRSLKANCISCAAGQSYLEEVRSLRAGVDVVVGTPARLLLHVRKGDLNLNSPLLQSVVLDEADVLVGHCYEEDLVALLGEVKGLPVENRTEMERNQEESDSDKLDRFVEGDGWLEKLKREEKESEKRKRDFNKFFTKNRQGESPIESSMMPDQRKPPQLILCGAAKTQTLLTFMTKHLRQSPNILNHLNVKDFESSPERKQYLDLHPNGWKVEHVVSSDAHFVSPSLQQVFVPLQGRSRMARLIETIQSSSSYDSDTNNNSLADYDPSKKVPSLSGGQGKTIVFVNSVRTARYVSMSLRESGIKNLCIDSFLSFKQRNLNLHKFSTSPNHNLLVSTGLLSYGLDIPNVNHVVLFDMPSSLREYLHRAGRTSRGGAGGKVSCLVSSRYHGGIMREIQEASRVAGPIEVKNDGLSQNGKRAGLGIIGQTSILRKIMKTEEDKKKLWALKGKKGKREFNRKKLGLGPRRTSGAIKQAMLKQTHFRHKAQEKLEFLRQRGRLGKHELLPKRANAAVEEMDTQEFNSVIKGADGAMQIIPKRRKSTTQGWKPSEKVLDSEKKEKKMVRSKTNVKYDDQAVPIEGAPTFADERKRNNGKVLEEDRKSVDGNKHLKKHKPWF
eukprot:GDKJ01026411.1.p1 GENE.GDKJ01026411.1~~GDKJ01026411.1.p1  ORF type:complete len:775 (-),score=164.54 GDKJ01026411.1:199-2523(-)